MDPLTSEEELGEVLDEVSGHLNAQHARLVDAAVAMLANRSWWSGDGVEEPHRFLCWRTAVAPSRARQVVAIAERVGELPRCTERFRAGELSIDQMAAIAARAPWWTDAQVADLAPRLTVAQLRRTLAAYPFPEIPAPDAPAGDHDGVAVDASDERAEAADGPAGDASDVGTGEPAADDVSPAEAIDGDPSSDRPPSGDRDRAWWGWGDDGRFRLHLEVAPDSGLVIEQALREARDRRFDQLGVSSTWADAVRDVAERSLDQVDAPSRRDRFRIHLHLDVEGAFTDAVGRRLPQSFRRHVGCDGTLSPVFHRDALPISVGRSQRVIPPRLRRQVVRRDHGACRVPGCGGDTFVEIHHVIHWEDDGATESPNLLCLCPAHHRMHHRGELGIAGDADQPDGVTFTSRSGRVIAASGARPTRPGAPPPPPGGRYRHPLGERLDSRWLTFDPPHLPAA